MKKGTRFHDHDFSFGYKQYFWIVLLIITVSWRCVNTTRIARCLEALNRGSCTEIFPATLQPTYVYHLYEGVQYCSWAFFAIYGKLYPANRGMCSEGATLYYLPGGNPTVE